MVSRSIKGNGLQTRKYASLIIDISQEQCMGANEDEEDSPDVMGR